MVAVLQAERMFGTRRFLMLYFGAGVFSNACTFVSGRSPYSLGASGCIFGLVGAFAAFYYKNRKRSASVAGADSQRATGKIRNRLGRRDGGGGLIPMGTVDLTEEDRWKIYGDLNED
eukprot:gene27191-35713_t